ncbi:hypothetical protein LCGC14_2269280, partial [marine sediment metagenome]
TATKVRAIIKGFVKTDVENDLIFFSSQLVEH